MSRRKSLILIAMVVLLLTFTVSGTIAWLAASTDPVENVFTPGKVDTTLDEEFGNSAKTKIVISNKGKPDSTVPVFVRVSVSGYYVKDVTEDGVTSQVIVEPWGGLTSAQVNTEGGWFKGLDGFYYYKMPIAPDGETSNLLQNGIVLTPREDGSYLVVNVLHQSIQADGTTTDENDNTVPVVTAEWGVYVVNGQLSLTKGN